MTENYLTVLEESLQKKLQVMEDIQQYNLRQQEMFQSDQVDMNQFDAYVEEKGALIERLESLDNGFESLYGKVAAELEENRAKYATQIKRLQELVTEVTDKSVMIQAQEARNKKLVEAYFQKAKGHIGDNRRTSKAAYDYYRNMSKGAVNLPQFMDRKK